MDRKSSKASSRRSSQIVPGKFGKLLAVGMAVALIWGTLLLLVGIYLRFKFGTLLSHLLGKIEDVIPIDNTQSETGSELIPYTRSITDDVNFGSWLHTLAALVLVIAILMMIFSCLGIFGGLNRNKFTLYITIVVLLVTAMMILFLISFTADSEATVHVSVIDELKERLDTDYRAGETENAYTLAMNAIMLWFQCCGIEGDRDFHNLTFHEYVPGKLSMNIPFKVSPACCRRNHFETKSDQTTPFEQLKQCARVGYDDESQLNIEGCYTAVFDIVSPPSTVILILILIWNMLVLLLTVLTIMEIGPIEVRHSVPNKTEAKEEVHEVTQAKKFVPFANISSYSHADLSRIKSTEIW